MVHFVKQKFILPEIAVYMLIIIGLIRFRVDK